MPNTTDELLVSLGALLDRVRSNRSTITYLQAAEALAIPSPHRIHKLTKLLETLMEQDAKQAQPHRAALVVSRARSGLPADGFFIKAASLGLFDGTDANDYHQRCLSALYNESKQTSNPPNQDVAVHTGSK